MNFDGERKVSKKLPVTRDAHARALALGRQGGAVVGPAGAVDKRASAFAARVVNRCVANVNRCVAKHSVLKQQERGEEKI